MKICLVSNHYPPDYQGDAELYVSRLAEALVKDHQVVVLTTGPGGPLKPRREVAHDGTVVYRLAPLNLSGLAQRAIPKMAFRAIDFYHPQVASSVGAIIARERPDVIHIHNWVGLSLAAVLSSAASGHFDRVPVAITPHDYSLCCLYGDVRHPNGSGCPGVVCRTLSGLNRMLTGSVGLVVSPSRYALELLSGRGFFPRAERAVLPYSLPASNKPRTGEKKTYDALFLGRLERNSGVDLLLRAFRALAEPSLRLHIAGDGPMLAECRQLAQADPRVSFHGSLAGEERAALLNAADCLIVPSRWPESWPLSIQDAFLSGPVVIASRVGGIPEMVRDGVNGLLIEPGDQAALASAIERLRQDPALQVRLRAEARQTARLNDLAFHASHLVEAYRRLIASNRISPLTRKAA